MSTYTERLKDGFNEIAKQENPELDALQAVYDDSYVFVTEAFEACKGEIYLNDNDNILPKDLDPNDLVGQVVSMADLLNTPDWGGVSKEPDEKALDYFQTIQALSENDPDSFDYSGRDLLDLRRSYREALLLAKDHLHEHMAYRNISIETRDLYYQTSESLDRAVS